MLGKRGQPVQLPGVYLQDVNQEHTRVNTHAARVYTHSRSSSHPWTAAAAAARTCADTLINLLIRHVRPPRPHPPLTSGLKLASSGPFKIKRRRQIYQTGRIPRFCTVERLNGRGSERRKTGQRAPTERSGGAQIRVYHKCVSR